MNDKKAPLKKPLQNTKRKPPASLFLWLLAFLVLASLIVLNSSPYFSAPEEWTANFFLSQLEKGAVVSAEIMPESDRILATHQGVQSRTFYNNWVALMLIPYVTRDIEISPTGDWTWVFWD